MKKLSVLVLLCLFTFVSTAQVTVIPFQDSWKYLDNGSNQGTAWRGVSFNDANWKTGNGKFGYGITDANTVINFGPDSKKKFITTYFRKTISLTDPGAYPFYQFYVKRDDGLVVYVNGTEVYRNNMPSGSISFDSLAISATDDGYGIQTFTINNSAFVSGNNVIAVEVHQQKSTSSDIAFDLMMTSPDNTLPTVVSMVRQIPPSPATSVEELVYRITFSEPVTGVGRSDFSLVTTGSTFGTLPSGCVVPVDMNGSIYDITVSTVYGTGTIKLNLKNSGTGIADLVGNLLANGGYPGPVYTIDQTAPTVTGINRQLPVQDTVLSTTTNLTYRILFTEPVTGVDPNDFILSTLSGNINGIIEPGSISIVNGGTAYDITVSSVSGTGTLALSLIGSGTGIQDSVGNLVTTGFNGGQTYTVIQADQTPPSVVSINRNSPSTEINTTATSLLSWIISFSEPVSGVDASDFTLAILSGSVNGILSVTAIDSTNYEITVNGLTGTGTLRPDLKNTGTSILDKVGNIIQTGFTAGQTFTIVPADQTAPSTLSINRFLPLTDSTNTTSLVYRISFSEPVNGVDSSDFILSRLSGTVNGRVSVSPVDGSIYEITVHSLTGSGMLRVDLKSGGTDIADSTGNVITGGFTSGQTYTVVSSDQTAPYVITINRHLPATDTIISGPVTFQLSFSEPVSGLDTSDLILSVLSGTVNGSVTSLSQTDSATYLVTIDQISGLGILRLDLKSSGTGIADVAGNPVNDGFSNGQSYTMVPADQTPPVVVSIDRMLPDSAIVTEPDSLVYRVIFSENVSGVDPGDFSLAVENGTVSGSIQVTAIDSSTYDLTLRDISGDGVVRIDLNNSGTGIRDEYGNAINGGYTGGQPYTILLADHTAPSLLSINRYAPLSDTVTTDTSFVVFRATFSEPVTGLTVSDFSLVNLNTPVSGDITVLPVNSSVYDVRVSNLSGKGIIRVDLNAETNITDTAGNAITGGFTAGENYTIVSSDQTAPAVSGIIRYAPIIDTVATGTTSLTWEVQFSEPVSGVDVNDFQLTVINGDLSGQATLNGTDSLTYRFTLDSLTGFGTVRLDLKGSNTGIQDTVGNNIDSGFLTGEQFVVTAPDILPPFIQSITRQFPLTDTVTIPVDSLVYRILFSEPVTGVAATSFTLVNTGGNVSADLSVQEVSSVEYQVVLTSISGTGAIRIEADSVNSAITDEAGNVINSVFTSGEIYHLVPADQAGPMVTSIMRSSPLTDSISSPESLTWRVIFSEPASGVDAADFGLTVLNGSVTGDISASMVDGSTYDITLNNILGSGTIRLDLLASGTGITDTLGQAITTGYINGETYFIIPQDTTSPFVISSNRLLPLADSVTGSEGSVRYRVEFSEPVSGVDPSDFMVTTVDGSLNATVDSVLTSETGSVYEVTVSFSGTGMLRLDLTADSGAIADAAGNVLQDEFTSGQTYTIVPADQVPPVVLTINRFTPLTDSVIASGGSLIYRVIFSEPVTGVGINDFLLVTSGTVTGLISGIEGSNEVYDITISEITGTGDLRMALHPDSLSILDLAGNALDPDSPEGQNYIILPVPPALPQVLSIIRYAPDSALVAAPLSLTYRVFFNKPVRGVDASDFTLNQVSGNAGGTIRDIIVADGDSSIYDVVVDSIYGTGSLRLDLNAGETGIEDTLGNFVADGFTFGESYTLVPADQTGPAVVSINRFNPLTGAVNAPGSLTWRIHFSEPVSGVDSADFVLTVLDGTITGNLSAAISDSSTYDVTLTNIAGSGTIRLDLLSSATGITDTAGNGISSGYVNGETYTIIPVDTTAPFVVSITRLLPLDYSVTVSTGLVKYRVEFSEPVSGVDSTDFQFTTLSGSLNGQPGNVVPVDTSGRIFEAVVTFTGTGILRLDLNSSATNITDTAGNVLSEGFTSGQHYTIVPDDQVSPFITSIERLVPLNDTLNADVSSVTWKVLFSEPVSGLDSGDFLLSTINGSVNGVIADLTGQGSEYQIRVDSLSGFGAFRLDFLDNEAAVTDTAGNPVDGGYTGGESYVRLQPAPVDNVAPYVQGITRKVPAAANTSDTELIYQVTFSEPVSGMDTSDFSLTTVSGSVSCEILSLTVVNQDSAVYEVRVGVISGTGTIRLDLNDQNTGITDTVGNALAIGYFNGEEYTIFVQDLISPAVLSISRHEPLQDTITTDMNSISWMITFSEPVSGVDETDFSYTLLGGFVTGTISLISLNDSSYVVTMSNLDGTGIVGLGLNAEDNGITDLAGNGIDNVSITSEAYTIVPADQTAPTVISINRSVPLSEVITTAQTSLVYTVRFSEPVIGVDLNDFNLTAVSGAVQGTISVNAVDSTEYQVTISSISGTGTVRLDLNNSSTGIVDFAGNSISSGFTDGQSYIIVQADVTAPVLVSVNRQTPLDEIITTATRSVVYRVTFSEPVLGVQAGDFTLNNISGNITGSVSITEIDNISYDVVVSSLSGTGIIRLDLNAASTAIEDTAGNDLNGGFINGQTYTIVQDDQTAPAVISINRQTPANDITTTLTSELVYRVNFSEPVSGVDSGDFVVSTLSGIVNARVASVNVISNQSYEVRINSISGTGTLRLDLKGTGTSIRDTVSNLINGGFTAGQTYTIVNADQTAPVVVSINRQSPTASNVTAPVKVTYRVTFSEPVIGVDTSDFILSRLSGTVTGTLGILMVDNMVYDVSVNNISGTGTLRLDLKNTGTNIVDSVNNSISGGFTGGQTYNILHSDQTAPVVLSLTRHNPTSSVVTNVTTVTYRITFSERVLGVDETDFNLVFSGTVSALINPGTMINVDGSNFDIKIDSIKGAGTLKLELRSTGTGIMDTVGNAINGGYTSGQTYTIDQLPYVVSIRRQNPSTDTSSSQAVTYRITFSEKVSGVDSKDFIATRISGNIRGTLAKLALETTGIPASDAVQAVNSTGMIYDVTVKALAGKGLLRLDLKTGTTNIVDQNNNMITSGYTLGESYDIDVKADQGFQSFSEMNPVTVSSHTGDKPQAKLWTYAGKWWSVLATTDGTKIYRQDGNVWTDILTIAASSNSKADCIVAGNVTHILLFRGTNTAFLVSVEYVPATNSYKLWTQRPTRVSLSFGSNSETATLALDGTGRMWIANDGAGDVNVRWSDAPYSTWSAPYVLATGTSSDDITSIVTMPGKIGVMWSNQNTQRFGFRTHTDGDAPTYWSTEESPGSQSALNIGNGFADDHINIIAASDGTLYCVTKTSYDVPGQPKVVLLVRRPSGTWDNAYTITSNEGTRAVALLNESTGKLKVVYTTLEGGEDILYRETSTSDIAFGPPFTIIGGNPNFTYNYPQSTHQTYTSEVIVIATNLSASPLQVISIIANDSSVPLTTKNPGSYPGLAESKGASTGQTTGGEIRDVRFIAYPNPVTATATIELMLPEAGDYSITLYNNIGKKITELRKGTAEAGKKQVFTLDGSSIQTGLYFLTLQTLHGSKSIKLMVSR